LNRFFLHVGSHFSEAVIAVVDLREFGQWYKKATDDHTR
jgi:hypothetical protein